MKISSKLFAIFSLLTLLALALPARAQAFDGRAAETILIGANEVVEGDLYANANHFTLDGTIKGDLVVFGTNITINGTIEGDLIAAGQTIILNGVIMDDARIAGAVLQIDERANIGGDLISAGASLETKADSQVSGELVVGAAQALLAGNVTGDVLAGSGALDLRGQFEGNVTADVGDPHQDAGGPPLSMFFPQSEASIPNVSPGLAIAESAKIKGDLEYTQFKDIKIPANVVGGKVTRKEPVIDPSEVKVKPTPAQVAMIWTLNLLRSIATLILLGLLLGWLAPAFLKTLMEKIQTKTAASLGWGVVSYAAFFFSLLLILVTMILGGILFGVLTLDRVSGAIVWMGILAMFALAVFFILSAAFVTKIVVARLGGKLILSRIRPDMAENKYAPLIVGAVILAALTALPFIGWVFNIIAILAGLGAIWLWGSELWQSRKTTAQI